MLSRARLLNIPEGAWTVKILLPTLRRKVKNMVIISTIFYFLFCSLHFKVSVIKVVSNWRSRKRWQDWMSKMHGSNGEQST